MELIEMVAADRTFSEDLSSESTTQRDWQYPFSASDPNHDHELNQFDYSIETLFSQINDLDNLTKTASSSHQEIDHRSRHSQTLRRPFLSHNAGSLETSQEEDSDNSSQMSTCELEASARGHDPIEDLMSDLMRRDISSITDSVRRICRILVLGGEVEAIYQLYNTDRSSNLNPSSTAKQHVDAHTCRSLCESYQSLYSNEPHICHLPTFKRYAQICQTLMQQVDNENLRHMDLDKSFAGTSDYCSRDNEDQMCLDDARDTLDCVLLACDQSQLDANWTDNKLYVNNLYKS